MRKSLNWGVFPFIMLLSLLLLSCSSPSATTTQKSKEKDSKISSSEKIPESEWEAEWNRTLDSARKEGKLILYTTIQPEVRQVMADNFEKKTGVKVEIITGRGGEISTRILNERRNGLYLADAYVGGTTTLLTQLKPAGALIPIMPYLFLPDVVDQKLWYKGVLPFMDREKLIIQTRYTPGGSMMDVAINPGMIKKQELVYWRDLLKPELKGKMNMQDPTTAGKGGKFINKALTYYGLDWDFMRSLAKQEPVMTRDERIMIEWVVKGKHILAINPHNEQYEIFRKAGAELDFTIFKETKDILGGGSYNLAMIDRPPHSNAARLFANWFLSKEAQTIISRAAGIQSARDDTPTDHLSDWHIRKPHVDYAIETEEFVVQEPRFSPITMEIFGHLVK